MISSDERMREQNWKRTRRCIVVVPNNNVRVVETGIEGRQIGCG